MARTQDSAVLILHKVFMVRLYVSFFSNLNLIASYRFQNRFSYSVLVEIYTKRDCGEFVLGEMAKHVR